MERQALDDLIDRQTRLIENILHELSEAQAEHDIDEVAVTRLSDKLGVATDGLAASVALRARII